MDSRTPRILGVIGALLAILAIVLSIFKLETYADLSAFLSFIFILSSLFLYGKFFKEGKIFNFALIGYILQILGGAILAILLFNFGDINNIFSTKNLIPFLVFYILWAISGYFLKQSFTLLGEKLNYNLFKIGGKLIFWGNVLTIILIGLFINLIGSLLVIVAFLTSPEPKSE